MPRKKSDATDGGAVTPEADAAPQEATPMPPDEAGGAPAPAAATDAVVTEPAAESAPPPEAAEPAVPAASDTDAVVAGPSAAVEPEPAAVAPGQPEPDPAAEPEPAGWPREEPVEPAPAAADQHEPVEEHHEEEAGHSFAARALIFLLILIAGAVLGIWGAPRLAPLLPSGLAPVAEWLSPGERDATARIAELESRLDAALGAIEPRFSGLATSGDVDARITAAVQAAENRIAGEVGELRESIGQIDGADTRQRLARLEAGLDGQAAELAALKEQLAAAPAAGSAAELDVYRAELDGLRAEMGRLSDEVQGLGARVDEVDAKAERQIEIARAQVAEVEAEAERTLGQASVEADLALVRAALASGQPFAEPLERVAAQPGVSVPEGLTTAAPAGVPTLANLRASFPDAAHAAIRASIRTAAGDGLVARSRAFLEAQVASRSLTPQPGAGTDAVLSRMEDRLRQDDLEGVLAEAEQLPSEAAAAMQGWLAAARLRAGAVSGLAELEGTLKATN